MPGEESCLMSRLKGTNLSGETCMALSCASTSIIEPPNVSLASGNPTEGQNRRGPAYPPAKLFVARTYEKFLVAAANAKNPGHLVLICIVNLAAEVCCEDAGCEAPVDR